MRLHGGFAFTLLAAISFVIGHVPRSAHAGDATQLFGVDLGTPGEILRALAASALVCQSHDGPKPALVCRGGLGNTAPEAADSTTFWIESGRVGRVYQLTALRGLDYAEAIRRLRRAIDQVTTILGRPPTVPVEPEPIWAQGLGDAEMLGALAGNRFQLRARWSLPGSEIGVVLAGDRNVPTIVLSLEPGTSLRCDPESVSQRLMQLFPPASAEARATAARELAACGVTEAAGALRAAASTSTEKEARIEAVRALGGLGTSASPQLESLARQELDVDTSKEALAQLARLGNLAPIRDIAKSTKPDHRELRTEARRLLAEAERPAPAEPRQAEASERPKQDTPRADAPAAAASQSVLPPLATSTAIAALKASRGAHPHRAPASAPAPASSTSSNPLAATETSRAKSPPTPTATAAPSPREGEASVPTNAPADTNAPDRAPARSPALAMPEPSAPASPSEPTPPPAPPPGPPDGTALALTTSLVAGGVWGGGLSLLAQQSSPSVVLLVGSAGAVIGGGTAWGLTHFGLRPSPAQALTFANTTAWGTLAGLAAWAASGSDNVKLKWGLLVGGESLGMGAGVLAAKRWDWTPSQILLADSLVLGTGLALAGGGALARPNHTFKIPPYIGYSAAPVMLASAVASRYLAPSGNDLHLMGAAAAASTLSAGLVAHGLDRDPSTRDDRLRGGLLLGMGLGYLGAAAASPWVEVSPARTWTAMAGLGAGNLIGLGTHMTVSPDDATRWSLGAGLGGLSLGLGTFLAYPHLHLGEQAAGMSLLGTLYGVGTWGLAMAASDTGSTPRARSNGGMLALGTAGGVAGLAASGYFHPTFADYATTMTGAALGATAGIGVAKLTTENKGTGEWVGSLAGSALGLGAGALFSHAATLRAPDVGAGFLGAGLGTLAGTLSPSLTDAAWNGFDRKTSGGLLLGLSGGAVASATLAHVAQARPVTVEIGALGSALGAGMGVGTGLLWRDNYSQPARIGALAGAGAGLLGGLALERTLHLDEGLGDGAAGLGLTGAGLGVAQGLLVAGIAEPSGQVSGAAPHALWGGALVGGSAGLASGLVLAKYFAPNSGSLATVAAGDGLGGAFARGLGMTIFDQGGRNDTLATLAGSLAGMTSLALVEHATPLRGTDLLAGSVGLGYGGLIGALAPSLGRSRWDGFDRKNTGGLLLGLGGGALGTAALSHLAQPAPATVATGAVGGLFGLGMGLGTGMLWPADDSQPARIGVVAGVSTGLAGSLLLGRALHLEQGFGDLDNSARLAVSGTGLGLAEGLLLAGLVDPSGDPRKASDRQRVGGGMLGGSLGLASGLVLSKYFAPSADNLGATFGGALLGGMAGRGLTMSVWEKAGRADAAGTLAGSLAAATALALTEHLSPLSARDASAGGIGLGFGGLLGALAPSLGDTRWNGFDRHNTGGLLLGAGGGALAATALSHVADPRPVTLAVGSLGGLLGAGMGLGAGLVVPTDTSQFPRIGVVAGVSAGVVGSLLLERPLRLDQGVGASGPGLAALGASVGVAEGLLLAGLADPSGEVSRTPTRQLWGGALLGGSLGLASGLVLSNYIAPAPSDLGATVGAGLMGGLFGRGITMLASDQAGRADTTATMAGSLAGVATGAVMAHVSPLSPTDFLASGVGAGAGALLGALSPTLGDRTWGGWQRRSQGGLMLGVSGGALSAALLAHATHVTPTTLGLGALGGLDGALTGLGVGLLADGDPASSQGARIGTVAGAAGGLAVGLGLWPRLQLGGDNLLFVSAASLVGGWSGHWAAYLGHQSVDDVASSKRAGGLLAGAGGMSLLASALVPALHVDGDLVWNALALDGLFSGAGAGAGALASDRDDAPVWGMLGGGTAGLLLGGVLHSSIDFERSSGLITFGALEGLWAGGWLPYAVRPSSRITDRERFAGLAVGGLGGAGLALVAGAAGTPNGKRLGMAGIGSAIGASLVGGGVLLSDNLHDQRGVGLMLGGTAAGLGIGALVSPYAQLDGGAAVRMAGGAGLGLAEGLVFAWSGRASTSRDYTGAGLIGAGLGATLGLATGADTTGLSMQQTLVATGFSAWGTWVGAFSGAFANRDPHEVVLGGLAAANLGYAAGYAALRFDLVDTRDFGWLSLAGAMGTALGGGAGAVFSTSTNPRPVLAGLALGPIVGIGVGSLVVPRLRSHGDSAAFFIPSRTVAPAHYTLQVSTRSDQPGSSVDILAARKPSALVESLKRVQRNFFDVTNWTPVMGALPPLPDDPNPAPFFIGVSGGLR